MLTEKSVRLTQPAKDQQSRKYMFVVANKATKTEIANAVEQYFADQKIKVASVNTMHVRGKKRKVSVKRGRRPSEGMTPAWKKAIVTLTAESPNIPMLEGA